MKAKTCQFTRPAHRYPNEADRSYFEQKLLDGITSVITVLGSLTFFIYLLIL